MYQTLICQMKSKSVLISYIDNISFTRSRISRETSIVIYVIKSNSIFMIVTNGTLIDISKSSKKLQDERIVRSTQNILSQIEKYKHIGSMTFWGHNLTKCLIPIYIEHAKSMTHQLKIKSKLRCRLCATHFMPAQKWLSMLQMMIAMRFWL